MAITKLHIINFGIKALKGAASAAAGIATAAFVPGKAGIAAGIGVGALTNAVLTIPADKVMISLVEGTIAQEAETEE